MSCLIETRDKKLGFVPLDFESTRLFLISDASFANARGRKSQVWFLVLTLDKHCHLSIIHSVSNRCKRVTRYVMAAKVHALILAFEYVSVIGKIVKPTTLLIMEIEVSTDSKTFFDFMAQDEKKTENRLQKDILSLR